MIKIISKIFIKNGQNYDAPCVRRAYGILCSTYGIILNIVLCLFKFAASSLCGSVAIAVDAIHNLTDSASSAVSLLSFFLSGQKKSENFPLGKGRIEYVAGFIISVVLIATGVEAAKSATTKIINPEPVSFSVVSLALLILSVLTKFYMAHFNSHYGKKISSAALKASATDCLCDCISTFIAIIAMVSANFTHFNTDAWGGLAVSMFIVFAGIRSAMESVRLLIGTPPDTETVDEINGIMNIFSQAHKIESIFLHDYGPDNRILDIKISFEETLSLYDAKKSAEEISRRIESATGYKTQIII